MTVMYRLPSPGVLRLIRLAAYQRAHGASWEAIARAVRRKQRTVRRWPMIYPKEWNRFYYEAYAQLAAAAAAEARIRLQQLMRTAESPAIRREAARTLARHGPAESAGDTIHLAEAVRSPANPLPIVPPPARVAVRARLTGAASYLAQPSGRPPLESVDDQ